MYKRILVATDGTDLSQKAVDQAIALAGVCKSELLIVKIVPRYPQTYFEGAMSLTQEDAAALLGIDQSKVSRITRGQFRGVSEAKLLELVARLGHDVKIVVGPVRRRAGKIELQFA